MSARREWVCDIAPGCLFKVLIAIHPTVQALRKAFGNGTFIDGQLWAMCRCEGGKDDLLVSLHFCPASLRPDIIAHEIFHGVAELIRTLRLDLRDEHAQELAAHAVTHLVQQVNRAAKLYRK
jgi:hypothetical protein